jgi:hypothetical protein
MAVIAIAGIIIGSFIATKINGKNSSLLLVGLY